MKAAVFFERDGILNRYAEGRPAPSHPARVEEFKIVDGVGRLLKQLKEAGFVILVTTVQPGVARGEVTRNELDLMHRILVHKLPVDDIFLCASDDTSHPCYKPQPGLFLEAAFKWGLDLDHSYVISDKWQDAKAAQVAGCTSVMIRSPWVGDDHHDFLVDDLEAAVRKILALARTPVHAAVV